MNSLHTETKGVLPNRNDIAIPGSTDKKIVVSLSFIALGLAFTSSRVMVLAMIGIFVYILAKYGIEYGIASYVFFSIWSMFTSFPIVSGITIISVILASYILVYYFREHKSIKASDFLLLSVVLFVGIFSFLSSRTMTGLMLTADVITACHVYNIRKRGEDAQRVFWDRVFFFLYVSTVLSIAWGVYQYASGNHSNLYLYGSYIPRFKSTIGTDRSCLIFCGSLVYCLLIQRKSFIRTISIIGLVVANLLTFSTTGLVCMFVVLGTYLLFVYRDVHSYKKIAIIALVIAIFVYIVYVYNFGSIVKPVDIMANRIHKIFYNVEAGDYAKATSGRSDLFDVYIAQFNEGNIYHKLFGFGRTSMQSTLLADNYSHNTYVDMLLYFGVIPCMIILYKIISNIISYRGTAEFIKVLMLKEAYLVTALGVSMLTNEYFWLLFIM